MMHSQLAKCMHYNKNHVIRALGNVIGQTLGHLGAKNIDHQTLSFRVDGVKERGWERD